MNRKEQMRSMLATLSQDVAVTKLPPGKAEGADDLAHWAHRRATGKSGVPTELSLRRANRDRHAAADHPAT